MTIVKTSLLENGDIPSATDLNDPYDDVATTSAALDADNTASNWITAFHMVNGSKPCNRLFDFSYEGTTADVITSTTYVTVNNVAPSEVAIAENFDVNDVLRVECSGLVSAIDVNVTYDNAQSGQVRGQDNYYAFQLLATYNDGAVSNTVSLGEWGYSFTTSTADPFFSPAGASAVNTGVPIAFQTFQFSTILRNDVANREYEKIELQAKVHNSSNELRITRNNIIAVRVLN
jgi:hypothetical protein